MEPLTPEEKRWIILGVLFALLICFIFYQYNWVPARTTIKKLEAELIPLETKLNRYKTIATGQDLQTKLENLQAKINEFQAKLPEEKEIPELLAFLKEAADRSGVEFHVVEAKEIKVEPYYIEMPFHVSVSGGYHELGMFINLIENSDRFMKVDDINLTTSKDNPRKHTLSLTVLTYMYNPRITVLPEKTKEK